MGNAVPIVATRHRKPVLLCVTVVSVQKLYENQYLRGCQGNRIQMPFVLNTVSKYADSQPARLCMPWVLNFLLFSFLSWVRAMCLTNVRFAGALSLRT